MMSHHLPRLDLHDLAVTPDEQYMLGVGSMLELSSGLRKHEAEKETRIIGNYNQFYIMVTISIIDISIGLVYNLAEKVIERFESQISLHSIKHDPKIIEQPSTYTIFPGQYRNIP